jgi:hypothetical protein
MAVIHQEPEVHENLTQYAGSWVAIREGKVVASALDPIELRDRSDHRDDDLLMPVPDDAGTSVFVL